MKGKVDSLIREKGHEYYKAMLEHRKQGSRLLDPTSQLSAEEPKASRSSIAEPVVVGHKVKAWSFTRKPQTEAKLTVEESVAEAKLTVEATKTERPKTPGLPPWTSEQIRGGGTASTETRVPLAEPAVEPGLPSEQKEEEGSLITILPPEPTEELQKAK